MCQNSLDSSRAKHGYIPAGELLKFARSLKGRLAIIAAIAIVVTGTVVLLFTFFMARSVMREQVFKSVEGVVLRTRSEIETTLQNIGSIAEELASSALLRQDLEAYLANAGQRSALSAEIAGVLGDSRIGKSAAGGLVVTTTDGIPVAATAQAQGSDSLTAENAALVADLKPGSPKLTFSLDGNNFMIVMAVPVTQAASGQVLGALVARSASPSIQSELQDTSGLGSSGRILLSDFVASKVSVLSYSRPGVGDVKATGTSRQGVLTRLPLGSDLPPAKAARGEKGEGEYNGLGDRRVVASYDFVPQPQWGVTAATDSSEIFAPIYRLRNVSIMVIVVLLFGGVALAYLIARTISSPLTELQEGVKAFAGGDLTTRVAISDGLEVTALAEEFNKMAGRLNDMYDNLEHKVQERTIELQEANERLKQLDDLKSDFVSMASHELRSPMASMKMGVSTVLREMVGPLNDDQKLMLEIAERNIDRLTKLTSELLDLTKIEAGQLDISLDDCDVSGIVREVVEADEALAQHQDVALEALSPGGPVVARCDRDRVYRVVQNLVGNALKFTEDGKITITLDKDGERVRVRVRDTGPGIPVESLPTIFDKWSQAHSETVSEKRGTGLGLAICKGIVEAHGGAISVESDPGEGTEFTFTLPVRGPDDREEKDDTDS